MSLTLCSNCRLPVNETAETCHLCGAAIVAAAPVVATATPTGSLALGRSLPIAAAFAVVATIAMLTRRKT